MKVTIYGAGAIGGWIGARLALAGHAVSVVARGAALDVLRRDWLTLIEQGTTQAVSVTASDDPAALGPQELVVIAVKAPAMADVAARVGPLIGEHTAVLTAMNGVPWWFCAGLGAALADTRLESVDRSGAIAAAIPAANTIGCVVHASCQQPAPGVVRHHQGRRLIVGEAAGEPRERTRRIARALTAAGFEVELSPRIQRDIWFKLWGNMTMNPISALTGATTDRVLDDELVRGFATRVMNEAAAIGREIGIPIEQDPQERHAVTAKLGAMRTSMLQDVEAGKPVEIDALVASVRELGVIVQVPTPFTDALLGLIRLRARVLGLY
ncbi:2-dehydropantoate 2-reductase [Burkholderia plantarii]|uniref:2-dehydropantoate 2-reductase n=1 Tax=Burkholderia plantarii TaxID=41899 RepID=UPI00272B64AA|nr:2-dehydropantoate 2-reductase [Burkholderia plantarii]WLE63329.1 2-dehydropantoate 2-reductase [Burkholderia plantarii]